jgi:hypothetical protein
MDSAFAIRNVLMELACYVGHGRVTAFPDLLAVCEMARQAAIIEAKHGSGAWKHIAEELTAAIAKAKGEQ